MDEKTRNLLIEIAGLLALIAQRVPMPNADAQAQELLDKIGDAIGDEA